MSQRVIFTENAGATLSTELERIGGIGVVAVCDANTRRYCRQLLPDLPEECIATIAAGDDAKTLDTAAEVWSRLVGAGATRRWAVVNIGGGVVTDLGGFAAATFKRGIPFVNVPTTLLGAVDAAVGGKTGVNFLGLKNEIGVFRQAKSVIISAEFFGTLPERELLSGYAEMLKHGLLKGRDATARLLERHPADIPTAEMLALLRESVGVKRDIVTQDPEEHGLRRALNLGHTAGHAIEELSLRRGAPVAHGYAVAWGTVIALVLSRMRLDFPSDLLHAFARTVKELYGSIPVGCDDYDALLELMAHDKKNTRSGSVAFTLLRDAGRPECGVELTAEDIAPGIDIARDLV